MAGFVVHTVPGSPYARAVMVALAEKGAAWSLAAITPRASKGPAHLARHPFGKFPVLEHEGFSLYETQAILRYLDRILPAPPLTPDDARAAARMDQVMNVNDWYLFRGVATAISFNRVVGPRVMGLVPDEAAIAEAMPFARTVFAELSRLLGDNAYFAGAGISLADLMVAPQIDMLAMTPEWEDLTKPNLSAWLERMNARPSMQATTWDRVDALAKQPAAVSS